MSEKKLSANEGIKTRSNYLRGTIAEGLADLERDLRIAVPALKVSLVVGTVLNLINNGEQWWTHHTVNLWQALLNYLVPFCVSSYSAARNESQRAKGG